MVIVDSSVWIDALNQKVNPETLWLTSALSRRPVGLTSLILCEVLRGIRSGKQFQATRRRLLGLPVFDGATSNLAVAAAQNFRALQRRGITVRKTIDCVIATFCIQEGHELLHRDNDFKGFEDFLGLQVVHP
jgi:predicted nucleic acid-binding protein